MVRECILVKNGSAEVQDRWVEALSGLLPNFEVLPFDTANVDIACVKYIVGWCPDALWVNKYPNLKALVSIGSGVDHIEHLDQLRSDIPVLRTVAPELTQRMCEFVLMCVLVWHRRLLVILQNQESHIWQRQAVPVAADKTVGVLGYGGMGEAVVTHLRNVGYGVKVWAKSDREGLPFPYFSGEANLVDFATGCDAIVCLLPLTERTRGILNLELLSKMSPGGLLINAARGAHLVNEDLVQMMRQGRLETAFLDGLDTEPLPPTSALWDVEGVVITSHSAAYISPQAGPQIIAANIDALDQGKVVGPMFDPSLGY